MTDEVVPLDAAGDRHDHAGWLQVLGDEPADVVDLDRLDLGRDPLGRHAPGRGRLKSAERGERAVGWFILDAGEVLQHHLPRRREFVGGEQRPTEDVGVDRQHLRELAGHHGARNADVRARYALRQLHAGGFEVFDEPAAVAGARAAEAHLAGDRCQTALAQWVVDGSHRRVKGDCDRLELGEPFADNRDPVAQGGRVERLLQRGVPSGGWPAAGGCQTTAH